jgi:hypothetical protein
MKAKPPLLTAIGALALFVLVAFVRSSALATPYCAAPDVYYEYGTGVEMECANPVDATIFYTINGGDPVHTGSSPGANTYVFAGPFTIPLGQCKHIKAIAYHVNWGDSPITEDTICNPPK